MNQKWNYIIAYEILLFVLLAIILAQVYYKEQPQDRILNFTPLPEQEYIELPAIENLRLKSGKYNQEVNLYNPESNNCDFVIEISLSDGRTIFKSEYVSPGEKLKDIVLNDTLKRGIYGDCQIRYHCYTLDEHNQLNGGVFRINIIAS